MIPEREGSKKSENLVVFERIKNRADRIRTCDLLNPIQAHYQAVLRPVPPKGRIDWQGSKTNTSIKFEIFKAAVFG